MQIKAGANCAVLNLYRLFTVVGSQIVLDFFQNMALHWKYIQWCIVLAKIQKWGNSQGLRLAKSLLAEAKLDVGDEVDISVKDGAMIVRPARNIRGRYNLKDLVARIPENCETGGMDWGEPVGKKEQ